MRISSPALLSLLASPGSASLVAVQPAGRALLTKGIVVLELVRVNGHCWIASNG